MLEDLHIRLAGVVIERLDFEELLRRYDGPKTLFHLDPPYWGSEKIYGKELFSRADFTRLEAALKRLQGRFIISLNDRPEVRELFGDFDLEAVQTTYTPAAGKAMKAAKLIIRGKN